GIHSRMRLASVLKMANTVGSYFAKRRSGMHGEILLGGTQPRLTSTTASGPKKCAWKSGFASGHALLENCTILCCRVFTERYFIFKLLLACCPPARLKPRGCLTARLTWLRKRLTKAVMRYRGCAHPRSKSTTWQSL